MKNTLRFFSLCALAGAPAYAEVGGVAGIGASPVITAPSVPPMNPSARANANNPSAPRSVLSPTDTFPGSRENSFAQNPSELNPPHPSGAPMPSGGNFGSAVGSGFQSGVGSGLGGPAPGMGPGNSTGTGTASPGPVAPPASTGAAP